jgi:hypothetical protein
VGPAVAGLAVLGIESRYPQARRDGFQESWVQGFPPAARFSACRETTKRACRTLPRSEARAHLCKLRLRAVRASPRHLMPPFPLATIRTERGPRRSRGRSGDRHSRFMSGGRNRRPAVRRGDPAPQAWGRKRRRVAPREPPSATTLAPSSRKSLLGQIWGLYGPISLSPRAPPLPDHAGTPCRTHSRHSALWAVAPTRSRQAAPLPVRCSLGSGAFALVHVCCCGGVVGWWGG